MRIVVVVGFAVVLGGFSTLAGQETVSATEQHYQKAREAFLKKDFAAARDEVEIALKAEPNNGKYHRLHAGTLMYSGRLNAARAEYRRALEINSKDAAALYNIGLIHDTEGDYHAAEEAYTRALAIEQDAATYNNRAFARLQMKKYDDAREDLRHVLTLEPDHVNGNINMAHVEIATGHAAEALSRLNTIVRQHPDNAEALDLRADALSALKRCDEAHEDREAAAAVRKLNSPIG